MILFVLTSHLGLYNDFLIKVGALIFGALKMTVYSYPDKGVVWMPKYLDQMKFASQQSTLLCEGVNQINLLLYHIANSRNQPYHQEAVDLLIDREELRRVAGSKSEYYLHSNISPLVGKIAVTETAVIAICLRKKFSCGELKAA